MRYTLVTAALLLAFAVAALGQATVVPSATPGASAAKLKVGDVAPDFTLTDTAGQKVKLSDFRGKNNVVLAFYVFAFTGG